MLMPGQCSVKWKVGYCHGRWLLSSARGVDGGFITGDQEELLNEYLNFCRDAPVQCCYS